MGVTGLWRLIEPAGKPVPVETLENKVLAVDISIWLHQMVKGYQDAKGAPLPNAHLMGLFQRLCKLLYFRIKPVFVFDGGFPDLKKQTIAKRQDSKAKYNSESERIKRELALLLSKRTAIGNLLGKQISPKKGSSKRNEASSDDIFKLPALPESKQETESESEDEDSSSSSIVDLHSIDIESKSFKSLPAKEKYDLLLELKETRKMNSWGRLDELPKKSDNFSDFQMQRLLKRRKVQECLEETEKEMGDGGMSLNELESLLNEEGIDTKIHELPTRRIASNDNTRFVLINNVKQALEAKRKKEQENNPGTSKDIDENDVEVEKQHSKDELEEDLEKAIQMSLEETDTKQAKPVADELEDDLEKAIKMSLECVDSLETSNYTSKTDDSWTSVLTDTDYSDNTDSEEEDGCQLPDMSSAKAYIMQYSDFTNRAINEIVSSNHPVKKKTVVPNVEKIIEELNNEKSIIVDKIELSSDEDCSGDNKNEIDIRLSKSNDSRLSSEIDEHSTQASVLCIENEADVITLDTSAEDTNLTNSSIEKICIEKESDLPHNPPKAEMIHEPIKVEADSTEDEFENVPESNNQMSKSMESNSSDDDFEEVPEFENKPSKPVVQLTLEMGQVCDEDDIFADVFTDQKLSNINNESSKKIESAITGRDNIEKFDKLKGESFKVCTEIISTENWKNPINSCEISESEKKSDPNKHVENKAVPQTQSNAAGSVKLNVCDKLKENGAQGKNCIEIEDTSKKLNEITEAVTSKEQGNNKEDHVPATDAGKTQSVPKEVLTEEKLNEMAEALASKEQNLVQEKSRLDRVGRNITEQMTKDAQELLQLFGIPYIVAPMEAEAQCAFLESVKLTDGTITDDSDIWLFGGKTVYKNFFNQKKHVLQFISERIEKSYNLSREQLILFALLVGSDYTTGVDGVGPVTAMEILASFPFNKKKFLNETSKQSQYQQMITGMQEFKTWVRAGRRTDNITLKKKLRNVTLNDDFPSMRVVQAYLEPNVEKSEDKFTWGEIDVTILRDYTKTKFGWSQNKLDEIMKPVLKRLQERKSQKTVHDYFKRKVDLQSLELQMSKRVKAAVQQMGPEPPERIDDTDPNTKNPSKPPRKRKNKDAVSKKTTSSIAGPSRKVRITANSEIDNLNVNAIAHVEASASGIDIVIPKTERFQEIIPQREKDKQNLLQNKMKAIEIFRKTKIDRKKKTTKRKVILPKEKADLSESSDED